MSFKTILLDIDGSVAYLTINRPKKLNALNKTTINELSNAISALEADSEVKAIILTGSGPKAFVAGADIKEFAHFGVAKGADLAKGGQEQLFNKIENCTTPIIAAVNGFALGGGLELAMACHMRVFANTAKAGLPEVSLGVIPGYGGTQRLPQLIGKGRAMELIATAGMMHADEAFRVGLANHVVSAEELLAKCEAIAAKISNNSSVAIGHAIKTVNAGFAEGVDGYNVEIDEFGQCFGTADFKEGTSAFLEKRKANFPGK